MPGFNSHDLPGTGRRCRRHGPHQWVQNASGWLTGRLERLLRELIGALRRGIRTDVPQHPEIWGRLCGWYRPRAQRTDMMAWSVFGAEAKVTVRRGQLILRTLSPIPARYRGLQLHPDDQEDPYVYRIDLLKYGLVTMRVVFS